MFDGLSSAWLIVFTSIKAAFGWQATFWDEFGILPTFLLVFVGATFFRFIVMRMFGAAAVGVSDSVVPTNYEYRRTYFDGGGKVSNKQHYIQSKRRVR